MSTPHVATSHDPLIIAGIEFSSRLLVGSGKYKSLEETRLATEASGGRIRRGDVASATGRGRWRIAR